MLKVLKFKTHLKSNLVLDIFVLTLKILLVSTLILLSLLIFFFNYFRTIISMPQPNGTIYTFGRDVNILWRHGIPQVPPEQHVDQGRISIIAWGWNEQFDL